MKHKSKRWKYQLSDLQEYRNIHPFAQLNRRHPTPAEAKLWERLRSHRVDGFKFRRQHVVGKYVVDFVCIQARLVVEVDGDIHLEGDHPQRDAERTRDLEKDGFRVIRFTNDEVLDTDQLVVQKIRQALHEQFRSKL